MTGTSGSLIQPVWVETSGLLTAGVRDSKTLVDEVFRIVAAANERKIVLDLRATAIRQYSRVEETDSPSPTR